MSPHATSVSPKGCFSNGSFSDVKGCYARLQNSVDAQVPSKVGQENIGEELNESLSTPRIYRYCRSQEDKSERSANRSNEDEQRPRK